MRSDIALRLGKYVTVVEVTQTLVDVRAVGAVALVAQVARALERTSGVVAGGLRLHTKATSVADVGNSPSRQLSSLAFEKHGCGGQGSRATLAGLGRFRLHVCIWSFSLGVCQVLHTPHTPRSSLQEMPKPY